MRILILLYNLMVDSLKFYILAIAASNIGSLLSFFVYYPGPSKSDVSGGKLPGLNLLTSFYILIAA